MTDPQSDLLQLPKLHEQLQKIHGSYCFMKLTCGMYHLHDDHIDAGDGVRITIAEGEGEIIVEDPDEGNFTFGGESLDSSSLVDSIDNLVMLLNTRRYSRF